MAASPLPPLAWILTVLSTATRTKPEGVDLPLSIEAYKAEVARRAQAAMMQEIERDAAKVRNECRTFAGFVRHAWKIIEPGTKLKWNWHLDAMCDHLQAISEGKLKPRLIINVPPGSSKSTIVSVLWQAWEWGPMGRRHLRYVSTSFDLGNVKRDTGKTLDVIRSEWFRTLWPECTLKTEGVLSFSNHDTGSRLGVSFYGVTGKRGDRLIVDDPHSLKGAESEAQRDGAVLAFIEGGLNRINDWETSAVVIVMQRLHELDLTGVLLARNFGFVHLMLPMEFEEDNRCVTPLKVDDGKGGKKDWTDPRSYDGELLDPVRVPAAANEQNKATGEYAYNGQYQQRPAPREGGMFKVDKLDVVAFAPAGGRPIRGWDLAASKDRKAAYTAGVKMRRVQGIIYIEDVIRDRWGPAELRTKIREVADADKALNANTLQSLPQDPAAAGKVQKHDLGERLAGLLFKITTEGKLDKVARAEPFAAMVENGSVKLVKGAWNHDYIEEMRTFPAGRYKDQVDASSRAFGEIVSQIEAPVNAGPELVTIEPDSGNGRLVDYDPIDDDPWALPD
jgi:predicted phage terminase large subunit-like protein